MNNWNVVGIFLSASKLILSSLQCQIFAVLTSHWYFWVPERVIFRDSTQAFKLSSLPLQHVYFSRNVHSFCYKRKKKLSTVKVKRSIAGHVVVLWIFFHMADFKVNVSEELKNIAKPTTTMTLMLWSRLRGLKLLLVLQWGREVDLSMVQSQFFTVKMRSCCNTYLILHSHCTICTIIQRMYFAIEWAEANQKWCPSPFWRLF